MKAKTQITIGEVTAGIMAILGGYRLISVLSLFTPYQLPIWSSDISLPSLLGTLEAVVFSVIYVYAIRRNKLKAIRLVYRIWWVVGLIELSIVFLAIFVAGKWAESIENLLLALILLLCLGLPFGLITLLWWTGLKGLERIVETGTPFEEQKSRKLKLACPQCGRSLKGVTEAMIGDIGVCPKCKAEFTIKQKDKKTKDEQNNK